MNFSCMGTLLMYSTAMCVLPLATFYVIHRYVEDSVTMGAMGAVVMVQVIIAAYIYQAWNEEEKQMLEASPIKPPVKKKAKSE